MSIYNAVKELLEIGKEHNRARTDFLKHILLMASGLLGILVSFRAGKSPDTCTHYAFVGTVSLIALGILSGSIALYDSVSSTKRLFHKYKESLKGTLNFGSDDVTPVGIKPLRVFSFFESICYIAFSLSVVCICVYAVLLDFSL